ncbi:MAG: ABC transporter substrate-binding protein, partial [Deltaproteobacteria bacterium]|nr:ABC transporter substrate-binding protein [Deltaproteobacteria bacterium]
GALILGLGLGDLLLSALPGAARSASAAVKTGGVSASVVTIPTNFQAVDEGLVLLDQAPRYFAHYDFSVIAVNTNFARSHPQAVVGVLKAVIRATRWFYQEANRDRAVDLIQRVVKVSPKYAALTYDTLFRELKAVPPQAEVTEQGLEPVIEIMVELGQLPGKIPPLQYVDDSYRQQALKALAAR